MSLDVHCPIRRTVSKIVGQTHGSKLLGPEYPLRSQFSFACHVIHGNERERDIQDHEEDECDQSRPVLARSLEEVPGSARHDPIGLSSSRACMRNTEDSSERMYLATLDSTIEGQSVWGALAYAVEKDGVLSVGEDLEDLLQLGG